MLEKIVKHEVQETERHDHKKIVILFLDKEYKYRAGNGSVTQVVDESEGIERTKIIRNPITRTVVYGLYIIGSLDNSHA